MVFGEKMSVQTKGFSDIQDITHKVQKIVDQSKCQNGIVTVTTIGSTASITTIEFEPALVQDMTILS